MRNGTKHKTQNDAPFVAFYDMLAVTFVLPDEMADVSIAGLQWFILIPRLNHTGSLIIFGIPLYENDKILDLSKMKAFENLNLFMEE